MSTSTKTVLAWQSAKNTKRNLSRPPRAQNTGMWMAPTLQRLGRASKDTGTTFIRPGYMATNAQLGEYYVDKSGHMVKNKIVKIGKYYYRYGADGRFVKRSKTRSKLIPKKKHSKRHLSD